MKRFYLFCGLLILFFSCQRNHDLRGHWHIYPMGKNNFIRGEYEVIDIQNDIMASFGQSFDGYAGLYGGIEDRFWHKRLRFGGECIYLEFDFKLSKDTLYLFELNSYGEEKNEKYRSRYKGYRCEKGCCNQVEDMIQTLKINVQLPTIHDTTQLIKCPKSFYLAENVFYGFPKKKYQELWGTSPVLSLGHIISTPVDIPILDKKTKIRKPKELQERINIFIYTDKNIRMEQLKEIMKKYEEIGYEKVYYVIQSNSNNMERKIWLKPFDLSNLEELDKSKDFRTVEDWLNASLTTLN